MKAEITKNPSLLTNGFVKTSGSDGTLSVDTTSYLPLAGGTMTGDILMTSNKLIGGSTTTSDLYLQTTTGVGTTGADMHFLVGNNGDTEAMTILNSADVGIGTNTPNNKIQVVDLINFNNTDFNTLVGYETGKNLVVGAQNNTYLGYRAGLSSAVSSTSAADSNTGIGYLALTANTSGSLNTAVGYSALTANLSGTANTAIGYESLLVNTTGFNNVAIGRGALKANIGGSGNVAVGINALLSNQSGVDNFGLGTNSLNACISGTDNVAIGRTALQQTTGSKNVGIGRSALNSATGDGNIAIGYFAGTYETGSNSFYVGNGDMGTSSGDKANALMYGVMSPGSGANFQTLQVNAKIGAGIAPTAFLTLRAGSTTATRAPLKFTSGSLLSVAEAGACEFLTDKFYATITTGPARKELALNAAALTTGSILFSDSSGQHAQDNSNLFWDDTNNILGLGTTSFSNGERLKLAKTYTDTASASYYAINSSPTANPASASSGLFYGVRASMGSTGAQEIARLVGGYFQVFHNNTATSGLGLTEAFGGHFEFDNANTGKISSAYAGTFRAKNSSTGTIGSSYGVHIARPAGTASGTVTNTYGLYVDNQTSAAGTQTNLPFGIHQVGTADRNYFGSKVGIGITSPTASLHLQAGTATANTAPLQFTSGTVETSPRAGVMEFTTDDVFFTITTGAARKAFILDDGTRLTSGRVPFATTNGRLTDDADMTFSGDTLTATKFAGALNGTVGATTPSSGVFTSLQVDSITNDTGLAAGTYTPTLTGVLNVASSTARQATYMRVGNTVTVSGQIDITPTVNNTETKIGISLPIASAFTTAYQAGGTAHTTANSASTQHGGAIYADATNDRVELDYFETHGTEDTFTYQFTYEVI